MKNVVLSADGDRFVYSVPDAVADQLEEYCMYFCCHWLKMSPQFEQYSRNGVLYYTEKDFIQYLNEYVFPEQPSILIKNLGWIEYDAVLPEPYKNYPAFNF